MARVEAWRSAEGGLEIRVRVTPRGGRDAIDGLETLRDGQAVVKTRVCVAPEAGAANDAVPRVIAAAFACAPSAVTLRAGATARIKTFAVRREAHALGVALAAAVRVP